MLTNEQMRQLAHDGARLRIQALQQEIADLEQAFPEAAPEPVNHQPEGKTRRKMSVSERRAVSERMKAFWRNKRKNAQKAVSSR